MRQEHTVKRGQRFRDARPTLFGRVAPEWTVRDVFVGSDGLSYARVFLDSDPSRSKTLSVIVLTDRHHFVPGRALEP
ncbi:MAG TPA: hypothetical protein VN766_20110 [Stellaceae bacterium]|jgi:hypothetical protein|nr:hypothetical protein [Stellaceae bacterium]